MVLADDNFATIVGAVGRAGRLRQHPQVRPLPALDEHRCDPHHPRRPARWAAHTVHAHPDALGQPHHGWPTRHRAGSRPSYSRRPRPAPAPDVGAHPHTTPAGPSGPPRRGDGDRHAARLQRSSRRQSRWPGCGHHGIHDLRRVSALQRTQRGSEQRKCVPAPHSYQRTALGCPRRGPVRCKSPPSTFPCSETSSTPCRSACLSGHLRRPSPSRFSSWTSCEKIVTRSRGTSRLGVQRGASNVPCRPTLHRVPARRVIVDDESRRRRSAPRPQSAGALPGGHTTTGSGPLDPGARSIRW